MKKVNQLLVSAALLSGYMAYRAFRKNEIPRTKNTHSAGDEIKKDLVEQASLESFPASDPPGW